MTRYCPLLLAAIQLVLLPSHGLAQEPAEPHFAAAFGFAGLWAGPEQGDQIPGFGLDVEWRSPLAPRFSFSLGMGYAFGTEKQVQRAVNTPGSGDFGILPSPRRRWYHQLQTVGTVRARVRSEYAPSSPYFLGGVGFVGLRDPGQDFVDPGASGGGGAWLLGASGRYGFGYEWTPPTGTKQHLEFRVEPVYIHGELELLPMFQYGRRF